MRVAAVNSGTEWGGSTEDCRKELEQEVEKSNVTRELGAKKIRARALAKN
jgi:hypothetical protein